jgi:hypothetical protein
MLATIDLKMTYSVSVAKIRMLLIHLCVNDCHGPCGWEFSNFSPDGADAACLLLQC